MDATFVCFRDIHLQHTNLKSKHSSEVPTMVSGRWGNQPVDSEAHSLVGVVRPIAPAEKNPDQGHVTSGGMRRRFRSVRSEKE